MTDSERSYKSTVNRIGASLLFFLLLINVLSLINQQVEAVLNEVLDEKWADFAVSLCSGVVYMLDFLLPVAFFRCISRGKRTESMKLSPKLPKDTFAYIFAGMAVVLMAASLNHYMISFTNYSQFTSEMFWADKYETPLQIVMAFVTTAIIPAFVEEFLFRGMILTNLRPYGRVAAIVGSALLFGLMHQNIEQVFYATVAGLFLGYVYDATGSIWCGILLHLMNNAFSVFESVVLARWEETSANRICTLAEGIVFAAGAACLVYLLCRGKKQKPNFEDGVFGEIPPEDENYVACEIEPRQKVKLFFAPFMTVFVALCVLTMAIYVAMAIYMYGF